METQKSDVLPGSALYRGRVTHVRLRPVRHRLRYRIFMMLLDLDELPALAGKHSAFGFNRGGLVSFFERDHGDGSAAPLKAQIVAKAEAIGCGDLGGGKVYALCMPRVLGYVFNPLTVYFCSDRGGRVCAIVYEVNNTFGERHFYTLGVDGEGRIGQDCAKAFRVSPLMDMNLRYRFSLDRPGETIGVNILASGPEGPVLTASFGGVRRELNSGAIVREVLLHPAMTLKVIVGIHWEALRTWLKLRRARRPQGATHAGVKRS